MQTFTSVLIASVLIVVVLLSIRLINYLRRKNTNTELWATVFEGLTHKTMDLQPLKTPETYIEKKLKKDGQDKDLKKGKPS